MYRNCLIVSVLVAGITCSFLKRRVMPKGLTRGDLQLCKSVRIIIGMVSGFKSEWCPASSRNARPVSIGICSPSRMLPIGQSLIGLYNRLAVMDSPSASVMVLAIAMDIRTFPARDRRVFCAPYPGGIGSGRRNSAASRRPGRVRPATRRCPGRRWRRARPRHGKRRRCGRSGRWPVSAAHGATAQEGFQFVRRQLAAVVDQPVQGACLVALGCIDTPEPGACAADVDGVGIDDTHLTFDDRPVRPGLPYAHIFFPLRQTRLFASVPGSDSIEEVVIMRTEIAGMAQKVAGLDQTIAAHSLRLDRMERRLDRIERHLDLPDTPAE